MRRLAFTGVCLGILAAAALLAVRDGEPRAAGPLSAATHPVPLRVDSRLPAWLAPGAPLLELLRRRGQAGDGPGGRGADPTCSGR